MKTYLKRENFGLVIFDLDGTLYPGEVYKKPYLDFAVSYLTENPDFHQADVTELKKEYASGSSVTAAMHGMGISKHKWNKIRDNGFDITKCLVPDAAFKKRVLKLCGRIRTAVLTNNTRKNSEKILTKLGFAVSDFSLIRTSDDLNHTKPSREAFMAVADHLNVPYDEILSIGDRFENDIAPVLHLGGSGVLVCGPGDLIKLVDGDLLTVDGKSAI